MVRAERVAHTFVKSPFFERDDDELGPLNCMQNMLGVEEIGGDGGV